MGTGASKIGGGMSLIRRKVDLGKKGTRDDSKRYTDFGAYSEAEKRSTAFFNDPNNSNNNDWVKGITHDERNAFNYYTGSGYIPMNDAIYDPNKSWEDIPSHLRNNITNLENTLNKAELYKGINITRACDFKIFGAPSGEQMTISQIKEFLKQNAKDNTLTNPGLLSFGANNHGADIDGTGLKIHLAVPPSKGAGAYVNPISVHSGSLENEFLVNMGAKLKFDPNSLRVGSDGNIHINARWVGRESIQSLKKKKKK